MDKKFPKLWPLHKKQTNSTKSFKTPLRQNLNPEYLPLHDLLFKLTGDNEGADVGVILAAELFNDTESSKGSHFISLSPSKLKQFNSLNYLSILNIKNNPILAFARINLVRNFW